MGKRTWSFERSNERNVFPNSILSKNIVPNTNKNKYCKFLKILYYFQYKPTNILIPLLVNKAIKKTFRSFERSELRAHNGKDDSTQLILRWFVLFSKSNWSHMIDAIHLSFLHLVQFPACHKSHYSHLKPFARRVHCRVSPPRFLQIDKEASRDKTRNEFDSPFVILLLEKIQVTLSFR